MTWHRWRGFGEVGELADKYNRQAGTGSKQSVDVHVSRQPIISISLSTSKLQPTDSGKPNYTNTNILN